MPAKLIHSLVVPPPPGERLLWDMLITSIRWLMAPVAPNSNAIVATAYVPVFTLHMEKSTKSARVASLRKFSARKVLSLSLAAVPLVGRFSMYPLGLYEPSSPTYTDPAALR